LNAILDAIKTPGGGDGPGSVIGESWWGIVVVAPGEAEEYTDARYWVQPMHCTNTTGDETSQPTIDVIDDTPIYDAVTASNLAEVAASTHSLPVGFPVLVTTLYDEQGPPVARYAFCEAVAVGKMFAVLVWLDGPAVAPTDGNASDTCNRTYAACSLSATAADGTGGVLYGEDLTPERRRPIPGKLICSDGGEPGVGYYDESSVFHLWDANEQFRMWGCDS